MRQANPDNSDYLDVYLERAVYEVGAREMVQNSRVLINFFWSASLSYRAWHIAWA